MEQCGSCGQRGDGSSLKRCSRCKMIRYCSVTCQKRDWPRHKITCGESSVDGPLSPMTTSTTTTTTTTATATAGNQDTSAPTSSTTQRRTANTTTTSTTTTTTTNPFYSLFDGTFYMSPWERARSRAQELFPGNEIEYEFRGDLGINNEEAEFEVEVPADPFFMSPFGLGMPWGGFPSPFALPFLSRLGMGPRLRKITAESSKVFLLRLEFRLPHFDLGWVASGCNRGSLHVWFEMEDPRPHFRFSDLQPGHFLCIRKPTVTVLIRETICYIELKDASQVRVFRV